MIGLVPRAVAAIAAGYAPGGFEAAAWAEVTIATFVGLATIGTAIIARLDERSASQPPCRSGCA